jgi:nicotinamidase-related amidase
MARQNFHLLIIDPQNDFCDLPTAYCPADPHSGTPVSPALPVPGAHADMLRLAALIRRAGQGLSAMTITLDSHQHLDIAHPGFWQDAAGQSIAPFTQISAAALRTGCYLPRVASARSRAQTYLDALEAAGRYTHMVWPVHCEIGTWGHSIHHDLRLACNQWEETHAAIVTKLLKGMNPWTEHYSALLAEVPDDTDPATQLNTALLDTLRTAERVYIAGEAGSHCVKATTEHIVAHIGAAHLHKLVLITDCMSPVAGFEVQQALFVDEMRAQGLRAATAAEVADELLQNAD